MPQVLVPAAKFVVGLFAGAGATAFVAKFVLTMAISYGINRVLAKKPAGVGNLQGRTIMVREPTAPRRVVYGQVRVSGPLIFVHTNGTDNEYLHMIVALAGHEVEEIGDVYFNDELVISGAGTTPISKYTSHLQCVKLLGTDAQTAHATMTSNLGALWTANHRLRGIAAVYVRLKWDADVFPTGYPNISAVVKGKPLTDFRDDSTAYSTNPVVALYDYFTDTRYGMGVPAASIDTTTWTAAANACDEAVTLDAGGTEDRYALHGTVETSNQPDQVIEGMLSAFAGRLYYASGVYRLHAGVYHSPDVDLDESDLRGPITVRSDIPRSSKVNAVKGTFSDPAENWQPVDYPSLVSTTYQTEDGEELWKDLPQPFVSRYTQCERLAKIFLLRGRQGLTCSMPCKLGAMRVVIGQTVRVTNTRFGWTNKHFEVVGFQFVQADGEDGGRGLGVDLELHETVSTIYDWATSEEIAHDAAPNTDLPDPWTVAAPTGLTLASSQATSVPKADGTFLGRIKVTWTAPSDQFVLSGGRYEIQRKAGSGDYEHVAFVPGEVAEYYIGDVDEGASYSVRLRAINSLGVRSAWTEETGHSVTVDTTGPAPITGLSLAHSMQDLQGPSRDLWFTWTLPTDADLDFVRIRWKVSGAGSWAVTRYTRGDAFLVRGLSVTSAYDFDFTTFDRSGNESAGPNPGYSLGADTVIAAPAPAGVTIGSDGSELKAVWATTVLVDTGGSIAADNTWTTTTTVNGARAGDHVTINPASDDGNLKFTGRVSANDTVKIIVTNTHSSLGVGFNANVQILVFDIT